MEYVPVAGHGAWLAVLFIYDKKKKKMIQLRMDGWVWQRCHVS